MISKPLRPTFYVSGGVLARDAASYVLRDADLDLHDALRKRETCCVLAARQMGKTSLIVRTVVRLRQEGARAIIIDLAAFGQNVTAEQWYLGLAGRVGSETGLEREVEDYWARQSALGPLQRWMGVIRDVVLPTTSDPVFIFIDEIDATRKLPFSADEFFAAIGETQREREETPKLEQLTFCVLGGAAPSDLIQDVRSSAVDAGKRIELADFSDKEAQVLLPGLGRSGSLARALLRRILYWTGGHPYLTQRFCEAVSEDGRVRSDAAVDRVCKDAFLSVKARERDPNLISVRDRMLRGGAERSAVLTVYSILLAGKKLKDDPAHPVLAELRMAGVVRVDDGYLRIRNRIYEHVFDQEFVKANQPMDERERQEAAEWRGRRRVLRWAMPTLAAFAALAFFSWWQSARALRLSARVETNAESGMATASSIANKLYAASVKRPELYAEYVKVVDATKQFARSMLGRDPRNVSAVNVKAYAGYVAADDAAEHGESARARKLTEENAADAKKMASDSDIRLRAISARSYAAAAHTLGRLGDTSAGEAYAQKAEGLARAVSKQIKPDDDFTMQTLAATFNLLGSAEESMDHWEQAVDSYEHTAGVQQEVSDLYLKKGDNRVFQSAHAALEERNRIGRIEFESNQPEAARQVLEERSLRIAHALLEWNEKPSAHRTPAQVNQARMDVWNVEDMLGSVLASRKSTLADALKYYQDGMDTGQKVVAAEESVANHEKLEDDAAALARVQTLLGMSRESQASYTRYIALVRERATEKANAQSALKLGQAYRKLGDVELHHGNRSSAPSDYENAQEWLAKADARDSATQLEIATVSLRRADLEAAAGQPQAAEFYREAVRASERCVQLARERDVPADANAGNVRMMIGYESLAFGKLGLGDAAGARDALSKSLEASKASSNLAKEALAKKRTWSAMSRAAAAYGNRGWAELLNRHLPESIQASQAALQLDNQQAWIHAKLAHAFLLSNQAGQAKALYLAHRGDQMYDDLFEVSVLEDFAKLRKLGFDHPMMEEIEKLLGH